MKTLKCAPSNSIVFISETLRSEPPAPILAGMVSANATCVAVACLPEVDGETEFRFGKVQESPAGLELVFDGLVATPGRTLIVATVEEEILFEDSVPDDTTRVRVWLSHPRWPELVVIGWGDEPGAAA